MEWNKAHTEEFMALFSGSTTGYGSHTPEKSPENGKKAKGNSQTIVGELSPKQYISHLHGVKGLGVVPVNEKGLLSFGAIDVDVYPSSPNIWVKKVNTAKVPLVVVRSKSGGVHLFCFFSTPVSASKVLPLLNKIRAALGLPLDTEVFPKQLKLNPGQTGNWINLPYFNAEHAERVAFNESSEPLAFTEGLQYCQSKRVTDVELLASVEGLPLSDAPPCLQTLFLQGGPGEGGRNRFLFNCATYLKARHGDDYGEILHKLNLKLDNPIDALRLDRTVISSQNRSDYSYQCSEGVLKAVCNKELCGERKYGKGQGAVSDLSFDRLVQIQSSTPYYEWWVNGIRMTFFSETELMNQNKFRELCLRFLHKVPTKLKDPTWTGILNRALANIELEEVEEVDDLSDDSLWKSKTMEFFSRRKALRPSQIEDGLTWVEGKFVFFKGAKLLEHLEKSGLFRNYKRVQHRELLKMLGAAKARLKYYDMNKTARVWQISYERLKEEGLLSVDDIKPTLEPQEEISFVDKTEESF